MIYYAYHGPKNTTDFDWKAGYGLTEKTKRDNVAVGSQVIIIQNIYNPVEYQLCGIFEVISHYDDPTKEYKYRFELKNVTGLTPPYLKIDAKLLSENLPEIEGGNESWSNFQKHFCRQGISFQKPLEPEVEIILLDLLGVKSSFDTLNNILQKEVKKASSRTQEERIRRINKSDPKPTKSIVEVQVFNRNPDVVAEVLYRANGLCELCGEKAPFLRKTDGTPYLEVHHKIPLSENGDDSLENAQALCPNCHRKAHYG